MCTYEEAPEMRAIAAASASPLILVIDDDSASREVLGIGLAAAGYQVVTAQDGNEGVARYIEQTPDAVLVEVLMPEKDGLETIRELRKSNPNAKIVAMSGGGQIEWPHYLDIAVKLGANFALEKPIDMARLLVLLRALIRPVQGVTARRADRPLERWAEVRAHTALAATRRGLNSNPLALTRNR